MYKLSSSLPFVALQTLSGGKKGLDPPVLLSATKVVVCNDLKPEYLRWVVA